METGNDSDLNDVLTLNTNSSSSEKMQRLVESSSEETAGIGTPVAEEDEENEEDGSKSQFDEGAFSCDPDMSTMDKESEKDPDDKMELDSDEEDFSEDEEEEEEDEMDESEIDLMLERGLPETRKLENKDGVTNFREKLIATGGGAKQRGEGGKEYFIKKIVALEEKGGNTFEVMPSDWIQVRHSSGMPVYLHRKTRVVCVSKPYYLGPASVRRHSIPLSAIPCLAYRRALEKEEKDKQLMETQAKVIEDHQSQLTEGTSLPDGNNDNSDSCFGKILAQKRKLDDDEMNENFKKEKRSETTADPSDFIDESLTSGAFADNISEPNAGEIKAIENSNPKEQKANTGALLTSNKSGSNQKEKNMPDVKTLIPLAKVETARENASLYSVNPLALREYCKPLFKFTELECRRFKSWSARRRHTKEQKRRQLERPALPDNAQVIKFFDLNSLKGGEEQMVKKFNDYVFNPTGKSSVCILHEFVQHALRKQPTYAFQELENASTPYAATVMINEVPYGKGYGSSKKTAKAEAAKATLEILIPQMKGQLNGNKTNPSNDFDITEYFQQVEMSDPRIAKMCTSVSEPSPYSLLLTCLQRSFGKTDSSQINFEMLPTDPAKGNPPNQFKMSAGEHSVIVNASNKREGKQLASQLLLSKMHPHITNFGAFLKMYGNGSIKSVKEKKQEEQQITTLQSKASANSPNWAILNKLRHEMLKLTEQEKSGKPINLDSIDFQSPSTNQSESDGNTSESANAP